MKRRSWVGAAAIALVVAGGVGLVISSKPEAPSQAAGSPLADTRASLQENRTSALGAPGHTTAAATTTSPTTPNPDHRQVQHAWPNAALTAHDLAELRADLASHPNAEAEFQRVVGFLTFSQQWENFQAGLQNGSDPAALRSMAQTLDSTLPERWRQGELTGAQALQIQARLLDVLVADEPARQVALKQWRAQLEPVNRTSPADQQFLDEQARLVAAWRALPAQQQQNTDLQAQLNALRLKSFAATAAPNPPGAKSP